MNSREIVWSNDVAEGKVVLSSDEKNIALCILPIGTSTYVLLTSMVYEEDTTFNETAIGDLDLMN